MFGRRKRAGSNPPLNAATANPSATSAATQAFLKNRTSNSSLASAAAGAALRSRPTTPTSVADVETKRTLRRSGSVSSMASAGSGRGPPAAALERRGSSGSMTERTFRSPSPSQDAPVPSACDAPPVPAIPQHHFSPVARKPSKRASSVEAPPPRISSPPPAKATGRGSSLGPGALTSPSILAHRRSMSGSELTSIERPESRGSVNFSYPTGSRPTSPANESYRLTSPPRLRSPLPRITSPANQNLVYDPNSRSFVPESQLRAIEEELRDTAATNMPTKKRSAPKLAQATHYAPATVDGRLQATTMTEALTAARAPTATAAPRLAASQPATAQQPLFQGAPLITATGSAKPAPRQKKTTKKEVTTHDSGSESGSYAYNSSDNDSDAPTASYTTRPGLIKKPSIVREDREREEHEDSTPTRTTQAVSARPASPTSNRGPVAGRGHGRGKASASAAFADVKKHARSASQPEPDATSSRGPNLMKQDSLRKGRMQSVSPTRAPHFTPLATPENLMVLHQPPPRSISPRKSALKNSARGTSPSDEFARSSAQSASPSEASVAGDDHLSAVRKKSHRVSFDDGKIVLVGQSATTVFNDEPMIPSPQPKRSWFKGLGRKKDPTEDDDDVMKPRPTLPSFGSVREKKPVRESTPDRPLVRPGETPPRSLLPSPPLFTGATGEVIDNPVGTSTDQIVGTVVAQDAASKNNANISRSREPLPPEVTSKEGNADNFDDDGSDYSLEVTPVAKKAETDVKKPHVGTHGAAAPKERSNGQAYEPVPEINVLQATPNETEHTKEWPDMPGGWEASTASEVSDAAGQERSGSITPTAGHRPTDPTPADIGIAEPDPVLHTPGTPVVGAIASENSLHTSAIAEETEDETEHDSVYSDAAEDLSDIEGDGFQSLDAMVESPVTGPKLGLALTTPPESPTVQLSNRNQLSRQSSEPDANQGWDKASEYWSGLSPQEKRQKEVEAQEARVRAIVEDPEPEGTPTAPPKSKKKKKAIAQPTPEPVTTERNYMIKPGSKMGPDGHTPMMRASMRGPAPKPAQEPHMRRSMRDEGSVRVPASSQPGNPNQRPVSLPPTSVSGKSTRSVASSATPTSAPLKTASPALSPRFRRKGSDESDSSFKRARPATETISLKRSMRSMDDPGVNASSKFSIRSLSPVSSLRRPSSPTISQQASMRSTLRNANAGGRTLRGPPQRAKSPSRILGFGRSSGSAPKVASGARSRNSRFDDSSDEDEGPSFFRSRFADTSDEDEPAMIPPIKSKNKSAARTSLRDNSRSTAHSYDLSDSDEDIQTANNTRANAHRNGTISTLVPSNSVAKQVPASGSPTTPSQQGIALSTGSLRRSGSGRETLASPTTAATVSGPGSNTTTTTITAPPIRRRRGLMSSILGRNNKVDKGKVRKMEGESVVRRDTGLERSRGTVEALRTINAGDDASIETSDPKVAAVPIAAPVSKGKDPIARVSSPAGKLRKRTPSSNAISQAPPQAQIQAQSTPWPLPSPSAKKPSPLPEPPIMPAASTDTRPYSSDGIANKATVPYANISGTAVGGLNDASTAAANTVEAGTGVAGTGERPDLGVRRFTATGLGDVDLKTVTPERKSAGKKRWGVGGLKKVFGRS